MKKIYSKIYLLCFSYASGRTKYAPWLFYTQPLNIINDENRISFNVSFDKDNVFENELQFYVVM